MPTFAKGDFLQGLEGANPNHLLLFTANSVLTRSGALVMGAGAARALRDRIPGVDRVLGRRLAAAGAPAVYGLLVVRGRRIRIGAFQTKRHWREPSDLELIRLATRRLLAYLEDHPEVRRVDLNFPGVGLGGLSERTVRPILEALPPFVHVWKL